MNISKQLIGAILEEGEVPQAIKESRESVCDGCEFKKDDKCTICGCYIELKAAMDMNRNPKKWFRIEKTHCPLGKWPFIDEHGVRHELDFEVAEYYRQLDAGLL